jgi:hypothetical protein
VVRPDARTGDRDVQRDTARGRTEFTGQTCSDIQSFSSEASLRCWYAFHHERVEGNAARSAWNPLYLSFELEELPGSSSDAQHIAIRAIQDLNCDGKTAISEYRGYVVRGKPGDEPTWRIESRSMAPSLSE